LYYGELFDKLELSAPAVVGHSFGGLLAAEFAASAPNSVGRLVLIDPVGLWRGRPPGQKWGVPHRQERPPPPLSPQRRRGGAALLRCSERSGRTHRHARAVHLGASLFW